MKKNQKKTPRPKANRRKSARERQAEELSALRAPKLLPLPEEPFIRAGSLM